jgi:hypothetical protein
MLREKAGGKRKFLLMLETKLAVPQGMMSYGFD